MKDIKDYLHLYLNDVDVIIDSVTTSFKSHFGHAPGHKTQLGPMLYAIILEGHVIAKPILRPLSDMTEEEATEIAIIMYGQPDSVKWRMEDKGNYFNVYRRHYVESFTIDKASGDIDRYEKWDGETEIQITLNHHFITHYLLSRGFDLFGLIEAGLAIDKTKL